MCYKIMVIQWHFLNKLPVFSGKYFVNSCYNSLLLKHKKYNGIWENDHQYINVA